KEESWDYSIAKLASPISTIAIGLDGTTMLMREEGYRQAMVGKIALYNKKGEREHSVYIGATPEYVKEKFFRRLEKEIKGMKQYYPKAKYVGIADGAKDNWAFLEGRTSVHITDFYHATEYVGGVSEAIFRKSQERERRAWLEDHCHELKHEIGAAN